MTLAKDWRCPKCGHEEHEPVRIRSISHPCYVNDDGTPRTKPRDRWLDPVDPKSEAQIVQEMADSFLPRAGTSPRRKSQPVAAAPSWPTPTGPAVQLTLEGAA